jgi:hypothetical protein
VQTNISLPPRSSPRLSWPTCSRASRRTAGTHWATSWISAEGVAPVMQVCFLFGSEVSLNLTVIRLSPSSYMKHRDLDTLVTTEELRDTTLAKQCTNLKVWSEFSLSPTDRIIIPPQEAYLLPAPHHQLAGGVCPRLSDARPPPLHSLPTLICAGGCNRIPPPLPHGPGQGPVGHHAQLPQPCPVAQVLVGGGGQRVHHEQTADLGRMSKVLSVYH